jgi:hypothetical protein
VITCGREGHSELAKVTTLAGLAARGEHAAKRVVEVYKLVGPHHA